MTMHFGLRGRHEHEQLRWGDVEIKKTSSGTRYLEFNERVTKTRTGQGDANGGTRKQPPKIFEDEGKILNM